MTEIVPSNTSCRVAVIGLGPRGLGALEALASKATSNLATFEVDVFEPTEFLGSGPNFRSDESDTCLLNIPMRDIAIRSPCFSRVGDFGTWSEKLGNPIALDAFPTRPHLGRYLEKRYLDLCVQTSLNIRHLRHRVDGLRQGEGAWSVRVGDDWLGPYDEVLLVPGQPDVAPDDQLAEWQSHARSSGLILTNAYPAKALISQAKDWQGTTVAVRGLALTAFDVFRCLTLAQGGQFQNGNYVRSGKEPARILPFSLDGAPPFAKPATLEIDQIFDPTEEETAGFSQAITKASQASPDEAMELINSALVSVVARILVKAAAPRSIVEVEHWLRTEWDKPGTQETGSPLERLKISIRLAEGAAPPTIGYTIGQVWRKWQDELRVGFNPSQTPSATAEAIVGFDEGLKRYSYGPPVSACREMLALVEGGLIDLSFAADPEITLTEQGWRLSTNGASATATIMIDGVLPSPNLDAVRGEPISSLVQSNLLHPVSDALAALTTSDGQVISTSGEVVHSLCLLGRLALGSVIAVDSLHDCFGAAADRWAAGVMERHGHR